MTTAQSCSNQTTLPTKKKNDAYLQSSLRVKTDNFEFSSKIKLQHYEIDWFNPEVISSECIKYLKSKDSLPNNHASQLKFLMEAFEPAQIKISFSNAIGKIGKRPQARKQSVDAAHTPKRARTERHATGSGVALRGVFSFQFGDVNV